MATEAPPRVLDPDGIAPLALLDYLLLQVRHGEEGIHFCWVQIIMRDRSIHKKTNRIKFQMTTSASHLDSGLALPWLASGERRQLRVGLMSSRTALSSMQGYKIRRFYRNSPKTGEFGPHQLDLLFMILIF
jgi:hypothetical protein